MYNVSTIQSIVTRQRKWSAARAPHASTEMICRVRKITSIMNNKNFCAALRAPPVASVLKYFWLRHCYLDPSCTFCVARSNSYNYNHHPWIVLYHDDERVVISYFAIAHVCGRAIANYSFFSLSSQYLTIYRPPLCLVCSIWQWVCFVWFVWLKSLD